MTRMRAMRALPFAGAVALACFAALGSAFGGCGGDAFTSGPGKSDGSMVGQGDDGSGSGGDGTSSDGAPDGPSMAAGHTVYVAQSGHDTATGLDPLHPLRSVKQALHVAQGLADAGVAVPNVIVCAGSYFENALQVSFDVGLYGGYDCTTDPSNWTRGTCPGASYCFPTFQSGKTSDIGFANTTSQQATLSILGTITSATVIDGFTVAGGAAGQTQAPGSAAIDVAGNATPKLSNIAASGGSGAISGSGGTGDQIGSVGLRILDSAAPTVTSCTIDGGSGSGPTGSVGILVDTKGSPVFTQDLVVGGAGSVSGNAPNVAAIGLDVVTSLAGSSAPQQLLVFGSDPKATPNGTTIGVRVGGTSTDFDISYSIVSGGSGSSGDGVGVKLEASGASHLLYDRIWGGQRTANESYGVWASGATSVQIVDSEIHAGDVMSSVATGAVGVDLGGAVTSAQLVFDTIYSGASAGSTAINVETGARGVTIEDDLLLGNGTGTGTGTGDALVTAAICTGQLDKLDYTGFVNANTLLKCADTMTMTTTLAGTPPGISGAIDGSATSCSTTCANVLVYNASTTALCTTEAWCVDDTSCPGQPTTCLPSVLGTSWTSTDDGAASLGNVSGVDAGAGTAAWQIESPANFCKLTTGGTPNGLATKDLLGNARSNTPTMGAVEYMGTCHN